MQDYIRKVHYHETDKMGITHHSNYIRWMEEARTAFLDQNGCGYSQFEAQGLVSPVLAVEGHYKHTTTFDDEIRISVSVERYSGVKVTFSYVIVNNKTNTVVFTGKSEHCFLDSSGAPVIVKKKCPALNAMLKELAAKPTS